MIFVLSIIYHVFCSIVFVSWHIAYVWLMVYYHMVHGLCLMKASKLHTQQVSPEDFLPCIAYFYLLLLPYRFFGLCLLLLLVSFDIWTLYVHILCGLLSSDSSPYVRSVDHMFAFLYTLDEDSERPMDYESSLLRTVLHVLDTT